MTQDLGALSTPTLAEIEYDVHVFAVVRVKVKGIMATSHIAAIEKALGTVDFYSIFDRCGGREIEFAEEFSHYLVDEVGDEEHAHTLWYRNGEDAIVKANEHGR